jgi:hypothetical protein
MVKGIRHKEELLIEGPYALHLTPYDILIT